MTWLGNSNCYFCLHSVISYPSKWTLNLTYDVLMRSFLTILEGQSIKFHKSIGSICLRLKNFAVWICWSIAWVYQLKAKFTSIQLTTCKNFAEVKLRSDRSNDMVVEDSVICICCFTTWWSHRCSCWQEACISVFGYCNRNVNCHSIIVYICNVSFHFFNSVVVDTNFIEGQFTKVDFTIGSIGHSLVGIGITCSVSSQCEAKVSCVQSTVWKWFIKVKIYFYWVRCEGIIKFFIFTRCWVTISINTINWGVGCSSCQSMTCLSNSNRYFRFHLVIGHICQWSLDLFNRIIKGLAVISLSWSIFSKIVHCVLDTCELHITSRIVGCSSNHSTCFIQKIKSKLICLKLTTR